MVYMSRVKYLIKIFLCYNLTNIEHKGIFVTKEQFNQRLKILNLSLKDFSRISNVPYSTLNNWGFCKDDKTIPVPAWVDSYLMFYEKSKKYDYLAKEIFGVMKELEKK